MSQPNPQPTDPREDDQLKEVVISVCQPCLDGEKGECHYPGCIQWLRGEIESQLGERLDFEHRYEYADTYAAAKVEEWRRQHEKLDTTTDSEG